MRRGQIALLAAESRDNIAIATKLDLDRTIVNRWHRRFVETGLIAFPGARAFLPLHCCSHRMPFLEARYVIPLSFYEEQSNGKERQPRDEK